jgi:hypothetical protein
MKELSVDVEIWHWAIEEVAAGAMGLSLSGSIYQMICNALSLPSGPTAQSSDAIASPEY